MSQGNEQPGFWALIPASVRYDKELPPNAKLLYGEVTALSDKLGYCYAQNSYFSDLFGLSERSVTRLLSTLVDRGYLRVDVVRDTATQEVLERRIYAIYNTEGAGAPPPDKNVGTPPDKIVTTPPDKNVGEINTRSDHIPPIVPQGGPPKKKKAKSVPAWKPERFENASEIADQLKDKRTVVLDLESTNKDVARRLIDFLSGVAYAGEGKIKKVAANTYIITPYHVDIEGDLIDELENNGLYF